MLNTVQSRHALRHARWIFAGLIVVMLAVIGVGYGPRVFVPVLVVQPCARVPRRVDCLARRSAQDRICLTGQTEFPELVACNS